MHVLIGILYGFTILLSMLAYALITGASLTPIIIGSPAVVSGSVIVLAALDYVITRIRKLWA